MTELEKIAHLKQKYPNSERLFTVYKQTHNNKRGLDFTLIFGTDTKERVKAYIKAKEAEGLKLVVYSANLTEQSSAMVYRTKDK